eukprot:TRINITY_DN26588_c0_g1_i2.p1 TRINITY_DN26588_c0_g1~~TRINITY_DN26588_c0_g1_i2.p1  ORF type:complete len:305 (-),score=66.32 TRINITY_DN26588_c0_g1_i2:394-1308(-)
MSRDFMLELLDELVKEQSIHEVTEKSMQRVTGLLVQKCLQRAICSKADDARMLAVGAIQEKLRQAARQEKAGTVFQFYSKSKDSDDLHIAMPSWRKVLSNFHPVKPVEAAFDGHKFPTVEHYYQAAKYTFAGQDSKAQEFQVGGSIGNDPAKAKAAGSRRGFQNAGCELDKQGWSAIEDGVMWKALCSRASVDEDFCKILREVHVQGAILLHFERSGAKSYWGGSLDKSSGQQRGCNRLGEMLMALAAVLTSQGDISMPASCTAKEQIDSWTSAAGAIRSGVPWEKLIPHQVPLETSVKRRKSE